MIDESLLNSIKENQAPGEDLRYDDAFSQLKNANASLSPDPEWMLKTCAQLMQRSHDWRLCMYALNASAMAQDPKQFTDSLLCYAHLASTHFVESYPSAVPQKIATLEWCAKSVIVKHLKLFEDKFSSEQLDKLKNSLQTIYDAVNQHAGEIFKWHDLDEWLEKQVNSRTLKHKAKETVNKIIDKLVTPDEIESVQSAVPFLDKFIRQLFKENQYERAVGIARAHRWGNLNALDHKNNKTGFVIRQGLIDQVQRHFDQKSWENVLKSSEDLFLQPHGHFYLKLNYWSHTALIQMGETLAAESIIVSVKKLYKSYGQLFTLMYNGGQLFCDAETLAWVKQHCEEIVSSEHAHQDLSCCEQWVMEKDVEKVNEWMRNNPIKTKKDAFAHDYLRLKIHHSGLTPDHISGALQALFIKTIDESLHAWEPELAERIWTMYASTLKNDKQRNTNKVAWQSTWDNFVSTVGQVSMPAAIQILQHA